MKMTLVQIKSKTVGIEDNINKILSALDGEGDIFVFPEMFLTGYTIGKDIYSSAISLKSDYLNMLKATAKQRGKTVVIGAPLKSETHNGHVYNSALIITDKGRIAAYNKINLVNFGPFDEKLFFTSGEKLVIFNVKGFRMGVIICYDIFFPHLIQEYALWGVDGVVCPSASPSLTRPFFEAILPARAIENTIYMFYSNMVGPDGRQEFWGGAQVYSPRGELLRKAKYFQEDRITVDVDTTKVKIARKYRPTLRDTPLIVKRSIKNLYEVERIQ